MAHEINEALIKQIAKLAKLTISDEEISNYIPHMQKVLNHFSELETLNTDNIEPLITPVDLKSYLREDRVEKNISTEDLLEVAPEKVGQLFRVPPVI
jgi:aspartyl-tRNA(Asn)/glutamyl-tRNA(Gln) amidotransferase subunit C